MGNKFKFGAKKCRKRKSRMKHFNPNKKTFNCNVESSSVLVKDDGEEESDVRQELYSTGQEQTISGFDDHEGDHDQNNLNAPEDNQIISYSAVSRGYDKNYERTTCIEKSKHNGVHSPEDNQIISYGDAAGENSNQNGVRPPEDNQIISYSAVGHGFDNNYERSACLDKSNRNGVHAPEDNQIISYPDAGGGYDNSYDRAAGIEKSNESGVRARIDNQIVSHSAVGRGCNYERAAGVENSNQNGVRAPEDNQIISAVGHGYDKNYERAACLDKSNRNGVRVHAPEDNQIISYPDAGGGYDNSYERAAGIEKSNESGVRARIDNQVVSHSAVGRGYNYEWAASTENSNKNGVGVPEHNRIISFSDDGGVYENDYERTDVLDHDNLNDAHEVFMEIEYDSNGLIAASSNSVHDSADRDSVVVQHYDESAAHFVHGEMQFDGSEVNDQNEEENDTDTTASDVEMGDPNAIDDNDEEYEDFFGHFDASAATRIDGRRIVEMDFFLKQLTDVADHNYGECLFGDAEVTKEIKNGLLSKFIFQCKNCGKKFPILTNEDEKTTETLSVNSSAVLASNMIGIGFSQLEQFTSVLDIPTMCADRFKSLNDDIGGLWEMTAEQSMKEAAEEERQAAIERGDIDEEDGIPFISVVTDGCWCKRSYHKNYNALSGVAAIVGATFGKVLWIGVRNKYCVICVRHKNKGTTPPAHFCTCNYTGPSSDMEYQSIVQGFERSVEMYNVRYMKVIADGDSSTYSRLLEAQPYGHRIIEKDECCNHLLRNFRKQLESSTTGCPRGLTKHVENSLERIRKNISCAVKHRNDEQIDENEKISLLKSDINNVVHHVFGDHANCPSYIKEFCKEEENHIPALMQTGTYEKLSTPIRKLMYCAKDLLLGETNNIAEHYNSIVAKFVGGKRVNFALSNAYSYKTHAAAVQFNTKKAVTTLYQTVFQRNPPALTQKIESKRLEKAIREKNRRANNKANHIRPKRFNDTKQVGSGYGENCEAPDLSPDDFENEKKIFMEKLKRNHDSRIANEEKTRTKERSALFQKISSTVLMASNFGCVCKGRVMAKQVKDICKQMVSTSKATKHNNESVPVAKRQLEVEQHISIRECGIYMDDEHMCLAASPSGITNDDATIIEIQCPRTIASKDPNDASFLLKLPYMERNKEGQLGLKKSDDLYYQIQGQLHILDKNACIFAIWTSSQHKMYIEEIERDENFFLSKMKSRLITFYYDWLLPELVNPRLKRNMPVREPVVRETEQHDM